MGLSDQRLVVTAGLLYEFVVDSTGKYKFEFVVDRDGHEMFPHERSRICICRAFYLRKLA